MRSAAIVLASALFVACASGPFANTADVDYNPRRSLERFDLSSLVDPEGFVSVTSAMLEAHATCRFSSEVLKRVTFGGDSEPGMSPDLVDQDMCWGPLEIVDVRIEMEALAELILRPRSKGGWREKRVYMLAVFEKDGWKVYWPEVVDGTPPL
jgi:hypothetical protein